MAPPAWRCKKPSEGVGSLQEFLGLCSTTRVRPKLDLHTSRLTRAYSYTSYTPNPPTESLVEACSLLPCKSSPQSAAGHQRTVLYFNTQYMQTGRYNQNRKGTALVSQYQKERDVNFEVTCIGLHVPSHGV